jgi:hypothetical protein
VDFERVLRTLSRFFEETNTEWGVIGGLAMAAQGAARTTLDVDIVVDGEMQDRLVEFLESRGFETLYRSTGYSNHIHVDPDLGRVDVVYVRGDTSRELFGGMRNHPGPGGMVIPVPRPEHLVAMKAYSIKNDPQRTLRELADIRILLDAPGVDREEVNKYFEKYGLEELIDRLDES